MGKGRFIPGADLFKYVMFAVSLYLTVSAQAELGPPSLHSMAHRLTLFRWSEAPKRRCCGRSSLVGDELDAIRIDVAIGSRWQLIGLRSRSTE